MNWEIEYHSEGYTIDRKKPRFFTVRHWDTIIGEYRYYKRAKGMVDRATAGTQQYGSQMILGYWGVPSYTKKP